MTDAIERLEWHDAGTQKPEVGLTVLLWVRPTRPLVDPGWETGWWDGNHWWLNEMGKANRFEVTHWANPDGPEIG